MKKNTIISVCITLMLISSLLVLTGCEGKEKKSEKYNIVASFYPVYIMTLNVTDGANNVQVSSMAEQTVGCLHSYTLQTQDLKKVESADVFIQNGLDIENFMDKILNTFTGLKVIDSTENIKDVIQDEDEINGHTWLSIENNIKQVKSISEKLKEFNQENSSIYENNTNEYVKKLELLKNKYDTELKDLNGKKVVSLNESFSYLERDLGLDAIEIHTDHEESTISAEKLKDIINKMKAEDVKVIIIDKNDDVKNAQNLANETGAKIYKLDSGLSGKLEKDSYIKAMEENLEILKQIL